MSAEANTPPAKEQARASFEDNLSADEKVRLEEIDDAVLRAQGHESALERSFTWLGATGLAVSITNSWLTYASCFGIVLSYGGPQAAVFGVMCSAAAQWLVLLGLAELGSAMPSSGGAFHYTFIIASEKTRNFAAYTVGAINIIAWWVGTASGTIYTAISAFGIAAFLDPNLATKQWQVYLVYLLVIAVTLVPVFVVPHRHIDSLTQTSMYLSIVGFLMVIMTCLIMSRGDYQPGSFLTSNQNVSGWPNGVGWLMSIGVGQYCFFGAGAVTHIVEELPRPGKRLPQVINLTMLIGISTSVPWIITMCFTIKDLEAVQKSFLPAMEVFYQATGSRTAATILQAYLTFLYYTCIPSQWITSSRITWAFARDNGIPFSNYFKEVHPKLGFPVRTTLLSAAFCVIYGLLYIASTAAFNSIVNTAIVLLNITFVVPQGVLATQGRSRLPERQFSLGRYGYFVNWFSVIWLVVSGVFFCIPSTDPTTLGSMNYSSVVLVSRIPRGTSMPRPTRLRGSDKRLLGETPILFACEPQLHSTFFKC